MIRATHPLLALVAVVSIPIGCTIGTSHDHRPSMAAEFAGEGAPAEGASRSADASPEPGPEGQGEGPDRRPSGVLTAGNFDDNRTPEPFRRFARNLGQTGGALGSFGPLLAGRRIEIVVQDGDGRPFAGATVRIESDSGNRIELIAGTDGRVVVIPALDGLPVDRPLTASVGEVRTAIDPEKVDSTIVVDSIARRVRHLDLALVIDTTGSMGDELRYLQGEVEAIAREIHEEFPQIGMRFALVVYRDDGDEYVTRTFDFTPKIEEFARLLRRQGSSGGGDYPEAMDRAIEEADRLEWREDDTARVLFLLADAPPHDDRIERTLEGVEALRARGVSIYPVAASGTADRAEFVLRAAALLTGAEYLFLTDDSGIGLPHAEPHIPFYSVQRLDHQIMRMIRAELQGEAIEPDPSRILRSVGRPEELAAK